MDRTTMAGNSARADIQSPVVGMQMLRDLTDHTGDRPPPMLVALALADPRRSPSTMFTSFVFAPTAHWARTVPAWWHNPVTVAHSMRTNAVHNRFTQMAEAA